jgi:glycosyltransferase involved in cell wall biosynthesis
VKSRSAPLSVVQVNYAFDNGLADPEQLLDRYRTLTGWSEALLRAGAARVAVVQHFSRDAQLTRNDVEYVFRGGGSSSVARAVARLEPDIAHVNGLIFPLQTWVLRRTLHVAASIVVQNHSDGGAVGRSPRLRLGGRVARGAVDAFLFAAAEHVAAWRQAGFIGAHQPTYVVMEASTDLEPIARSSARAETGVDGAPAMLWVGRLNPNKDPLTVLAGFERAAGRLATATLTMIYGSDDLLPAVRERIDRSPVLKARVRLVGAVPHAHMPAFFSAADLFVVGSHHEGSGYSLMEACACGAVPVVTDIPTFRLLTGGAGALWRPGDAADCGRALVEVASRDFDAERTRLAEHFRTELTWDAVGTRALEIYRKIVSNRQ